MRTVAISACLMGKKCRYDASDNLDEKLLSKLKEDNLIAFCPEDFAFGSPRPTMDLIRSIDGIKAISNKTGADLSFAIESYANTFFNKYQDISVFIGKDRSPSCGVCSSKVYDENKNLLNTDGTGLMARAAKERGIECFDAEKYIIEDFKK